jgi:hypothetical protein
VNVPSPGVRGGAPSAAYAAVGTDNPACSGVVPIVTTTLAGMGLCVLRRVVV